MVKAEVVTNVVLPDKAVEVDRVPHSDLTVKAESRRHTDLTLLEKTHSGHIHKEA